MIHSSLDKEKQPAVDYMGVLIDEGRSSVFNPPDRQPPDSRKDPPMNEPIKEKVFAKRWIPKQKTRTNKLELFSQAHDPSEKEHEGREELGLLQPLL